MPVEYGPVKCTKVKAAEQTDTSDTSVNAVCQICHESLQVCCPSFCSFVFEVCFELIEKDNVKFLPLCLFIVLFVARRWHCLHGIDTNRISKQSN